MPVLGRCLGCGGIARTGWVICTACAYPRGVSQDLRIGADHASLFIVQHRHSPDSDNWRTIGTYENYDGARAGYERFRRN